MTAPSYQQLIADLYRRRRFGVELGLERMVQVVRGLERPPRIVRVAGTNGKGSTCAMIAGALAAAGIRAGRYSSPHLCRFTERFVIDGQEISEDQLLAAASRVDAAGGAELTFFEYATALAISAFAAAGVEVAVLEVGLGGRLDATRAVPADVVAITGVGLDHQKWLGETLEAIAVEKAGTCEPGVPAVIGRGGESEGLELLLGAATEAGADPVVSAPELYAGPLAMPGAHQRRNAAVAWTVLEVAAEQGVLEVDHVAWRRGINQARLPARLETLAGAPKLVIDVAHNAQAARALAAALGSLIARPAAAVIGISADKDAQAIAAPIVEAVDEVFVTSSRHSRAMPADYLASVIPGATVCKSVPEALAVASSAVGPDGTVVACGSVFLAGEARAARTGEHTDPPDLTEP
ncbi:MAG: bifunctional folylpolyglutamate synthase/dihydrofolate synthase [Deltaproteobacteria bacterium]|nr:bifunctional folylpolyglutamate synthase/dihydrofolate synthase [Deltaproteobacteria bacterium]